jgi:hypothetical protein
MMPVENNDSRHSAFETCVRDGVVEDLLQKLTLQEKSVF